MYVLERMAFRPRKVKNPTTDSVMLIHYLQQSKFFIEKIKKVRRKFHLPIKGLPLEHLFKAYGYDNTKKLYRIKGLTEEENNIVHTLNRDSIPDNDPFHMNPQYSKELIKKLESKMEIIIKHVETYEGDKDENLNEAEEEYERRKNSGFGFFKLREKMHKDIVEIIQKLRLADGLYEDIFLALAFNAICDIHIGNTNAFQFIVGKHEIAREVKGKIMPVLALLINHQFTQDELKQYMRENWEEIDEMQKNYLIEKLPFRNAKHLGIVQGIYELKEYKKKDYGEIIPLLQKKYEDNMDVYNWVSSKDEIKQAVKRYKDDLINYPKRNKWLWKILATLPEE